MHLMKSITLSTKAVFKVSRCCVACFQTSANLNMPKYRHTKTYKDMAQPKMQPIGPQDYQRWKYFLNQPKLVPNIKPTSTEDEQLTEDVINRVNQQIETVTHGRLFAVVQVASKQFKVTTEDIIVIHGYFEPDLGSVIQLEKVLMVGSSDFTIIGRPLINNSLLHIEATVIEKTLSNIITKFRMIPRKRHRRLNFLRVPLTMLRINQIVFKDKMY